MRLDRIARIAAWALAYVAGVCIYAVVLAGWWRT